MIFSLNNALKKIYKNSLTSFILQGAEHGLILLSNFLFAYILSQKEFGNYSYNFFLVTFFSTIVASPFTLFLTELSLEKNRKKRIDEIFSNFYLVSFCTIIIISILLKLFISSVANSSLILATIPFFLFQLEINYRMFFGHVYKAHGLSLLKIIFYLVCVCFSIYFFDKTSSLNIIFVVFSTLIFINNSNVKWFKFKFKKFKNYLSLYLNCSIQNWLSYIHKHLDLFIIGYLFSNTEVGIYALAITLNSVVGFPLMALNSNSYKHINEYSKKGICLFKEEIREITRISFLIGGVVMVLVGFSFNFFIESYYPNYNNSFILFLILSLGQFVNLYVGQVALILNINGFKDVVSRFTLLSILIKFSPFFWYNDLLEVSFISMISTIFLNLSLLFFVINKLKFNPSFSLK